MFPPRKRTTTLLRPGVRDRVLVVVKVSPWTEGESIDTDSPLSYYDYRVCVRDSVVHGVPLISSVNKLNVLSRES